nr:hypothetical protein [Pelotalea chapellei]
MVEDSSVFSIQWSIFPHAIAAGLTPHLLLERYLCHIRRCTCTLIRPRYTPEGIEFRLAASNMSLISLLPPVIEEGALVLRICGGFLVQPQQCERGELRFSVDSTEKGVKVVLQLSDYCPLLLGSPSPSFIRRWFYRWTQAAIHRLVTVRFLTLLYRDLTGSRSPVSIIKVREREGRSI